MYTLCLLAQESVKEFYNKVSDENAGFDVFVPEDTVFAPGEHKFVGMGVKAVVLEEIQDQLVPQNYWMVPRSSNSKTGLMMMNSVGVIDAGYRGELIAALWNTTNKEVLVKRGQRLVQIVSRDMRQISTLNMVSELPSFGTRGEGRFGSTGA